MKIYPSMNIHGIVKIEIKENEIVDNGVTGDTTWRNVVFTDQEGNEFTVTAFATHPNLEGVPVSFVRDLDEDSS